MYNAYVESEEAVKARWERMQKRAEKASKQNEEKTGGTTPPVK